MLSKSSKYAIKAVLYLAVHSNEEKKINPLQIAKAINIPAPFLAKTLQILTNNDIISSSKGRHGGFYLTKLDKLNTLLTIVQRIDGLDKFNDCLLGLPICSDLNPCPIHHVVAPLKDQLVKELTTKTIEKLAKQIEEGKTFIYL